MKPNLKVALSSIALLVTCGAGVILFNRQPSPSTASETCLQKRDG